MTYLKMTLTLQRLKQISIIYNYAVVPYLKHGMLLLDRPMGECYIGKSWLFIVRMNHIDLYCYSWQ